MSTSTWSARNINSALVAVSSHHEVELLLVAGRKLDRYRIRRLSQGAYGVAEEDAHLVSGGTEQQAYQIVAHDLDLAVAAGVVQPAQPDVVGAGTPSPHRGQRVHFGATVSHC